MLEDLKYLDRHEIPDKELDQHLNAMQKRQMKFLKSQARPPIDQAEILRLLKKIKEEGPC